MDLKSPQGKIAAPIAVLALIASVAWIVHSVQVNQPVRMDRTPGGHSAASGNAGVALPGAMLARKNGMASAQ